MVKHHPTPTFLEEQSEFEGDAATSDLGETNQSGGNGRTTTRKGIPKRSVNNGIEITSHPGLKLRRWPRPYSHDAQGTRR
jgi:hypothetical protein